MPREFPKPFFRTAGNCWFVQVGKEQIKLHPDEDEAMRLYQKPMAQRTRPNNTFHQPAPTLTASRTLLSGVRLVRIPTLVHEEDRRADGTGRHG